MYEKSDRYWRDFFKCKNPSEMKNWYKTHLGFDTDAYGTNFEWRQADNPDQKGFSQWSPASDQSEIFKDSKRDFIINYRVENLEILVDQLSKESVKIMDEIASFDYGKFVHILDMEGNKVELWEANDIEYEKIVEGRTK